MLTRLRVKGFAAIPSHCKWPERSPVEAVFIEDFSPLLVLSAFQRLDSDIQAVFRCRGWTSGARDEAE